jgi:hypothetical protein
VGGKLRGRLNGSRNTAARFASQEVIVTVGSMVSTSLRRAAGTHHRRESGRPADDEIVDIELAIPRSQIPELVALLLHRAGLKR